MIKRIQNKSQTYTFDHIYRRSGSSGAPAQAPFCYLFWCVSVTLTCESKAACEFSKEYHQKKGPTASGALNSESTRKMQ